MRLHIYIYGWRAVQHIHTQQKLRPDSGFSFLHRLCSSVRTRMKALIITFCLIGAALANPVFHSVLESSESASNSTESLSVSESAENNTSEIQSSEESISKQSSESESEETTSEDKTSEESDSQSDEENGMDSRPETEDDSMGSQENVRKQSWVSVFPHVVQAASAEDNTSTEVKGHAKDKSSELTKKHPVTHKTKSGTSQALLDTTSDSVDVSAATSNSSSSSSSESHESHENDTSSESTEDSNDSDSMEQVQTKDCVNGTHSCESEELFLQSVGDDAHFSVGDLHVPDEDDGELRLRR